MGCDIHMLVERRVDDRWVCVKTFDFHTMTGDMEDGGMGGYPAVLQRNYARFSRLAGVRGKGPEPKGIPQDLSQTGAYLIEDYGVDGHSHSYLPLADAAAIFIETQWWSEKAQRTREWAEKSPVSFYSGVDENDDQHRLVFWFDN